MKRWRATMGVLGVAAMLLLLAMSNAPAAIAKAATDVFVTNTAANPVPAVSADVSTLQDVALGGINHPTSTTVDVSHDRSVRIDVFMTCFITCPSGTQLQLKISEGTVLVDVLTFANGGFQSKEYEVPGVSWNLSVSSACGCANAAAAVRMIHRSN